MVVISSKSLFYRSTYDEYWKIANWTENWVEKRELTDELRQHGYKVPSSANKKTLVESNARCQQGFLSYHGCQPKELMVFCAQRHIEIPDGRKAKKAQLVHALQAADEKKDFPRFMELPPELRVQIYTDYFSSLGSLDQPVHPPISKVSRLLRQESLPLFYAKSRFPVYRVD